MPGSAGARLLEAAARRVLEGRTAIVVAHRLTQAASADRVVVLDRGRLMEVGTHAELLTTGRAYADLWNAWSAGRSAAGPHDKERFDPRRGRGRGGPSSWRTAERSRHFDR